MSSLVKYNFLGKSGLRVSNICLGTMTFGQSKDGTGPVQCSEEDSHKILDRFVELGGNFIDTADVYTTGVSEEIIGKWLARQNRDRLILATKVRAKMNDDPNGIGLSRKHIMDGVEQSLKRLQTSYIDLYQIHCWDNGTPIEETLSALNDLVKAGKVRYIGASNVTGWQLQKIVEICKTKGYDRWVALQQQYNLLCRETEFELVDVCRNEGLGMLPWSPLKGGWLSGKMKRSGELEAGSRIHYTSGDKSRISQAGPDFDKFNNEKTWKLLDLMADIAKSHGKSVAQVALRWLLQKDFVPSVIIGAKNLKQLEDNMGAGTGWEITDKQMSDLDGASMYDVPYPYEMIWRLNQSRKQ